MSKHTEAQGGAPGISGKHALPLDRAAGYRQTMSDVASKTRSPYNSAGGRHYEYEDVGENASNDNLKGQDQP
jgi:hypothetical protein